MRVRGFIAVGLALVCGVGALAGCATSSGGDRGGCVPVMTVSPRVAHPGDTVTLSSSDVCAVMVPEGGWKVAARQPLEDGRAVTVRSDDALDGSWAASVTLPADFPTGEVSFGLENWDYSTCPDGASCAGPFGSFRVAPTSATTAPSRAP